MKRKEKCTRNLSYSEWKKLYHEQNLRIHGIYVPNRSCIFNNNGNPLFREFRLQFSSLNNEFDNVSLKLPMVPEKKTPYSFEFNKLKYKKAELSIREFKTDEVPILPAEDSWHLQGFTFPFRGTKNPYFELRINPKITGYCPGKCLFCHRIHSHRMKPNKNSFRDPNEIINKIISLHGDDIFKKINRTMLISELFGSEALFLRSTEKIRNQLINRGYSSSKEYNCCATEVRSYDGLKVLHELVNPSRYSFSLECFSNRNKIMKPYKALTIETIYRILRNVRKAGFDEIQLNYIMGIDSIDICSEGFKKLKELDLVDSVGLSTLTIFNKDQYNFRHPDALNHAYYLSIVEMLVSLGIKCYKPESYDMGCAYAHLMEKSKL